MSMGHTRRFSPKRLRYVIIVNQLPPWLVACRGRGGSCPPPPRTDPGVRYYRTGLFRQPRFRNILFNIVKLSPAGRLALLVRLYTSGQGFLCGLRLPVSPFPL